MPFVLPPWETQSPRGTHDVPSPPIVASTSKLNRIVWYSTTTSQPPRPELHHGQDLVTVFGHAVIRFLPAMILDELVGIVDALERTGPDRR